MSRPSETDLPPRGGSFVSRSFAPLALITLGVVFLLGNVLPGPGKGGLVLLGLGAALAIGRVTTGRYGYAVPAGILLAIGCFITLQETRPQQPLPSSGWFFILLGLGFAASYVIGLRPRAVWPLFPATVLIVLGAMLFGWSSLAPLASFAWIVSYWPAVLVLIGVWLLFRDSLPAGVRQPVASVGGVALLVYGLLAAAASIAAGGAFARAGFAPTFGTAPLTDSITLEQPIAAGGTFTVSNGSGPTTIRGGTGSGVRVVATRHFSVDGQPPAVTLTPAGNGLSLDMREVRNGPFGHASWVDYDIEVPANVAVEARASSGSVELANVTGPLEVQTSSGSITASGVQHLTEAQASSGSIVIDGVFTESARVKTSSGTVQMRLQPTSAVRVDIKTSSGPIQAAVLSDAQSGRNTLTGRVGAPGPNAVLSIETSSGAVTVT